MYRWSGFEVWGELLGRAERVDVRWGLPGDEGRISDLLELNGMPRWVAFEERFVVAVGRDGEISAALRYRTEPKRLFLGLLVADPWVGERPLGKALYAGAEVLAREMGVKEILARALPYGDYPREAGYHRRGNLWRLDLTRPTKGSEELSTGGWRRLFALLGIVAVPFFRFSRG